MDKASSLRIYLSIINQNTWYSVSATASNRSGNGQVMMPSQNWFNGFSMEVSMFFLMEFQGIWSAYFEIPLMEENELNQSI